MSNDINLDPTAANVRFAPLAILACNAPRVTGSHPTGSQIGPAHVPLQYRSDERIADAYREGWRFAHGTACHNVPQAGLTYGTDAEPFLHLDSEATLDEAQEIHIALTFDAVENAKSFTPFEFTAHDLNDLPENIREDAWAAFDAGVEGAILADIAGYGYEQYGLPEWAVVENAGTDCEAVAELHSDLERAQRDVLERREDDEDGENTYRVLRRLPNGDLTAE